MKIRNMIGLAMLGGFLYAHQRRGGEWTLTSFKGTARDLWDTFTTKAEEAKIKAEAAAKNAADKMQAKAQDLASTAAQKLDDVGRSGFGGTNGPMRR